MKKALVLFVALSLPFSAYAGSGLSCARKDEKIALNLRALQSSMMVAALSCDQQKQYNQFVKKHHSAMSDSGDEIVAYFKRQYGSNYEDKLNRFITKLANEATKSSMKLDSETYCKKMAKTFKQLISYKDSKVGKFAEQDTYVSMHGVRACG